MNSMALIASLILCTPGDYSSENTGWNGLSYLTTTASEAKVPIVFEKQLDWSKRDVDEVLIFLAPTGAVSPSDLHRFIKAGGRAIVALERGVDKEVGAVFNLSLTRDSVIHEQYYRDHPDFPILSPPDKPGFLWYHVDRLILNHPAAFDTGMVNHSEGDASARIDFAEPAQSFAIEISIGRGHALFVSDSSIFINDMQQRAYGNKQFVANLLRYFPTAASLKVYLPNTEATGVFEPKPDYGFKESERSFSEAIQDLDAFIGNAQKTLATRNGLFHLSLVALVLLVFGTIAVSRVRQASPYHWLNRIAEYRPSFVDYWVAAQTSSGRSSDYSRAAAALGERFQEQLTAYFGDIPRKQQLTRLARETDTSTTKRALSCLQSFDRVKELAGTGPRPVVLMGLAEFQKLWDDCDKIWIALERT